MPLNYNALTKTVDNVGNINVIYPKTKKECVIDLDNATQSANGLMSSADKTKLDGVATGANNYVHPTSAGNKHIPSGGSKGDVLIYGNSSGEAMWNSSLAHLIDNGAKNLVNFKYNGVTSYNSGWAFTTPLDLAPGDYVLSFKTTSQTQIAAELAVDGSTITKYSPTGTKVFEFYNFTVNTSATRLRFWINGGPSIVDDLMICTLEDWQVSQNHVQFIPDLNTVYKEGVFQPDNISLADLNNVTETFFGFYDEPLNMPSGTSGKCYCRTSFIDSNNMMQELTLHNSNATSYIRLKVQGTWGAWKQITNA